ncbi:DMT family transporter [Alkalihalobacillus sp. BA299]|uniref:DMT family transporter n=1 Tax=Alkalihalobacillus sp. BA299 TaxID=2815938 RepID=UPI001ADAFC15|nr:DMT family transporter [Alkalihalobacillus sp. BA299]
MYVIYIIFALLSGLLISIHGVVNSVGAKAIGLPTMIAWFSIIQAIPAIIFILLKRPSMGISGSLVQGFKWYLFSGLIGITIVTIITLSISQIGALTAFVLVVLGQVIGAAIADHFGLFGVEVKPVSVMRIVSILIILAGVGLLIKSESTNQVSIPKENPQIVSETNKIS